MMPAGQFRHRVAFDMRQDVNPDAPLDLGNSQSDFVEQFIVAAAVQAKFGGETVMAERLTGNQPWTITVRQSALTRTIGTDWRARDTRNGTIWAIRSIVDPDDSREVFEILAQSGVAQ